jgi:hypothetical protein
MNGQRYGLFCMVTCSWIKHPGRKQRILPNIQVDFPNLSVVVNAGGGGSDIVAKQVPGRASRKADGKDHAYIIDFMHPWDKSDPVTNSGKPGPLLINDYARRRAYQNLGFEQKWIKFTDLPFLKQELILQSPTALRPKRNLIL